MPWRQHTHPITPIIVTELSAKMIIFAGCLLSSPVRFGGELKVTEIPEPEPDPELELELELELSNKGFCFPKKCYLTEFHHNRRCFFTGTTN